MARLSETLPHQADDRYAVQKQLQRLQACLVALEAIYSVDGKNTQAGVLAFNCLHDKRWQ